MLNSAEEAPEIEANNAIGVYSDDYIIEKIKQYEKKLEESTTSKTYAFGPRVEKYVF
jgi:hypothetical protein